MRSGLLFLPFLGVFTAVLAMATGRAYKEYPLVSIVLWILAALALGAWVVLDGKRLQSMFKRKGARHGMSQGLSVILAILLAIGAGYLSRRDRFNKSVDVTAEGVNTLSPESVKLVEQLKERKEPVKVLAFFQDEMKKNQFRKALALYELRGGSFEVEYIDPQMDPTRAMAENITTADTVLFKFGNQEARLTSFTEEKISNALVRVMKEKEKTIYFTQGHGEPDLNSQEAVGYQAAKQELESERFVVKQVNLLETGKVPEDADLLVIAGPKYDLQPSELTLLEQYLQSAKPLMVLVDAMTPVPNLNKLLETVGFRFRDDLLIIRPGDPRAKMLGQNNAIVTDFDSFSPVTADFVKRGGVALMTPNTRSIEILDENKMQLKPIGLAKSSEIIVRITGVKSEQDLRSLTEDRVAQGTFDVFGVSTGKVGGDKVATSEPNKGAQSDVKADSQGTAAKELRVFVGGSAQLASNLGAQRQENVDLFLNAINYLTQDEDFIAIRAKDGDQSRLELTTASSQFLLLFLAYVYPTSFLGAGVFYWMRRRRA
ncbi:GldG family protein [Oligoflexus tunisiensis]|uniref:GldG family protein n=1 Tax=Oligoflexus tunisiensis TaxID=708132 RepID=UPI00114CFAC2|nr:Gldg family protein [Oligoflexus tunisiensis]